MLASNEVRRVLVTGASGFIGRQSLVPLLERNFEVHALYNKKPIETDSRITWHHADLLEDGGASKLCAKLSPTHLLHFAWYVDPKDYKSSPENSRWVRATLELLRAFQASGGTRAVLAGTCMEYDWSEPRDTLTENSPIAPGSAYGKAKNETHIAAEEFATVNDLSLAWGRIFYLYGPHEAPSRLVPFVINSLLEGKPALCTSGEQIRDYSHVSDIALAFVALLDSDVEGAVNIGSGQGIVLKDLLYTIGDLLDKRELLELGAKQTLESEPPRIVADVSRLSNGTNWKSRVSLEEGLRATIDWWKHNRA